VRAEQSFGQGRHVVLPKWTCRDPARTVLHRVVRDSAANNIGLQDSSGWHEIVSFATDRFDVGPRYCCPIQVEGTPVEALSKMSGARKDVRLS
jgi:hypothetical protein